jgi:hypothetical protein
MPRSDWRSPAAYAYVSDLDPSGLAWEFLRRNPEYRREYRAVSEESQSNDQAEAFACRWGMRLCVAPDMPANKAALICPDKSRKRSHRPRTGRLCGRAPR